MAGWLRRTPVGRTGAVVDRRWAYVPVLLSTAKVATAARLDMPSPSTSPTPFCHHPHHRRRLGSDGREHVPAPSGWLPIPIRVLSRLETVGPAHSDTFALSISPVSNIQAASVPGHPFRRYGCWGGDSGDGTAGAPPTRIGGAIYSVALWLMFRPAVGMQVCSFFHDHNDPFF